MMKKALGEWPGGPKPSAFGCMEDTQTPSVRFLSPSNGDMKGHAFAVTVDVHDDCDVKKVAISVMPQGLTAVAMAAPYEWDLTGINGAQTITVTATDGSGRTGSATLQVDGARDARRAGAERERRGRRLQRGVGSIQRGRPGAFIDDVPALQRQEPSQPVASRPRRAHAVAPRPSPPTNRASYEWPIRRRSAHSSASSATPSSSSGGADQISTDCCRPTRTSREDRIATSFSSSNA